MLNVGNAGHRCNWELFTIDSLEWINKIIWPRVRISNTLEVCISLCTSRPMIPPIEDGASAPRRLQLPRP